MQIKNINIKIPLAGSLANVCTEFNIPDLTKKVPHILRVNVVIDSIITQDVSDALLSNTTMHATMQLVLAMALKKHFQLGPKTKNLPILVRNMPKLIQA